MQIYCFFFNNEVKYECRKYFYEHIYNKGFLKFKNTLLKKKPEFSGYISIIWAESKGFSFLQELLKHFLQILQIHSEGFARPYPVQFE